MIAEVPLKWVVTYNDDSLPESTDESTQIRYVEISDVNETDGITSAVDVVFGEAPSRARRILRSGDVIVSTVRTYLRAVAAVGTSYDGAICSTGFAVLRARGVDERFLKYAVLDRAFMDQVVAQSTGVSYPAINASDLVRIRIPLPAPHYQRAIADYLDRETAQIDAFIAKNEELITLLTERRAAVIADAVTGGVRQEARLMDSGVDWIGSIPASWEVRPLRWSARIRTGTTPSGDLVFADEPGEPWIRPDDLDVSGAASVASRWLTPEGAAQGRPAVPGATLVCTIGATLGKSGRIAGASYFNQQITSVSWMLNDEFLYWIFVAAREAVARLAVGNTLPILNNDKLATLRIPVPPMEEQGVLVDYIRAQTTRIDAAIQTAHRGVELAWERRAALISAAVTGKIDVGVAA